jgi:RNA methyltransferase, TrmH family
MLAMTQSIQERLRTVQSRHNASVKELRKAFSQGRTENGLCAVEGVRMIEEAIRSRLKIHALFVRASSADKSSRLLEQIGKHAEAVLLPDEVFDSAVETEHPQGVAALVKVREQDLESALQPAPALAVVAAGLQDPGNLGTVLRSAEAFQATGVISIEGSVNHWNAKVIRASAGSIFRLPVVKATSETVLAELRNRAIRLAGLVASASDSPAERDGSAKAPRWIQHCHLTGSCALFIGNEGAGLAPSLAREMDEFIAIPQARVESLNAGVAASIALYEARRQRSAI